MGFPFGSVVFMLLLAAGMFYGQAQYKKRGAEWGKLLTIVCGFLIIVAAFWTNLCQGNVNSAAIERERQYQRAEAIVLANQLASVYKGNGKCLLIHNPVFGKSMNEVENLIDAFEEGFIGKVTEIRPVPIKETTQRAIREITAEDFNKIIDKNSDCDLIITLVSLPFKEDQLYKIDSFEMIPDENDSSIYIKDPNKKYPLFGVVRGSVSHLETLLNDGLIGAMSLYKPKPTIDEEPVPESAQEAFNKRYLIVTPQNLKSIKSKHPSLFPKPRK